MLKMICKKVFIYAAVITIVFISGCKKEDSVPTEPDDSIPLAAMVYLNSPQQVIKGFGGVSMPGWIPDLTTEQVNTAFGTGEGQLGLSILRIRVPYNSAEFSMEIPTALKAKTLGATIIASPWTPPAWMKGSNNIIGGTLNSNNYADYAAHLKSFVDYMGSNGVPIYAISIQNEPDVYVSYESCTWYPSHMLRFVKENSASIGTKIIMPEVSNFNQGYSDPILNDADAASKVAIIGGHIYGGGLTSYPLAMIKGKEVWMTEHLNLDTSWDAVFWTGIEIFNCLDEGMSAYLWWYIRRYYGPMDDNGNVTKRGYVLSQYARFIRPGFVKVKATENPQDYIFVIAFKKESKTVIVAINNGPSPANQQFVIRNGSANSFTPYVTSETKNCRKGNSINASDGKFYSTLDAESITTFVSD
jgi:glucuronoarabinoxylan endo-1,4-beta-xylanase